MTSLFENYSTESKTPSESKFNISTYSQLANSSLNKAFEALPDSSSNLRITSWILFVISIIFAIVFS